jgi:hypothetical protein
VRNYAAIVAALSLAVVSAPEAAADPGPQIGTATMRVSGAPGPVTLRYQINGGPQQTETGVTLPWEKQYPVYNEISTSVSADAATRPSPARSRWMASCCRSRPNRDPPAASPISSSAPSR